MLHPRSSTRKLNLTVNWRMVGNPELICPGSGLVLGSPLLDSNRAVTASAFLSTNSTDELITSDCPSSKQSKSILSRAGWSPDAEPYHLVKQRIAFQS